MEIKPKNVTPVMLKSAGIPEDYWECDFSNYQGPIEAKDVALKYLKSLDTMREKGIGLLFVGPYGSGKTTLSFVIMKYLTRARWVVFCTSLGEIIENVQKSWKQTTADTEEANFITRCREADFLLLDDLSKEHSGRSGFVETTLDNLVRFRTQHRAPTILTTNLNKRELQGTYGESVMSLFEGKVVPVVVKNEDHRKTVQKNDTKVALIH